MIVLALPDAAATEALGAAIARTLVPADVVLLDGELGAGKTTLVRGLVAELGGGGVTSPTFTLRHEYPTTPPITHVDCWRLDDAFEIADLGLDDVLDEGGVLLIEWGARAAELIGAGALRVELDLADGGGRVARLSGAPEREAAVAKAAGARGIVAVAPSGADR